MSLIGKPMRPSPTEDLKPWFLTLADVGERLDCARFSEIDQPLELDIGCGRGLFLVNAAVANPDTNYVGIEIDYREGRRTARRLKKRELGNARVLGGDARIALESLFGENSVSAVHVYFPDPWWKRKHRRRRIFTDTFLELVARVLEPGGELHSWTDVAEYFQVIQALVTHHPRFEELRAVDEHVPQHDMDYLTSYERKGRQSGSEIHRGRWKLLDE